LGAAVMLGVGIGFASFVAGWALREGIATSFARMGADLLVVPRATLVNITSSLLTVQPTDQTLPLELSHQIAGIPGIARLAPQRIVPALVEGRRVNLVAFDPVQDFSVLTWMQEHRPGPVEGLIAGGRVTAEVGAMLSVCGMPLSVYGRLAVTGVGPLDESYFLSFGALADVVSFCRASGTPARPSAKAQDAQVLPVEDAEHAEVCSPDLVLDRVSAFLLQLSPEAKVEQVKFGLAQLPGIKIVQGNSVLTSSRQH
jgi:putative ABC transport system permease protein